MTKVVIRPPETSWIFTAHPVRCRCGVTCLMTEPGLALGGIEHTVLTIEPNVGCLIREMAPAAPPGSKK